MSSAASNAGDLQALVLEVKRLAQQQRTPPPVATGIEGAARHVDVSVRKFKQMEAEGTMPKGRATGTRSFIWLYTELDAAAAALPKKVLGRGEPARLAAGKAVAKGRR